MSFFLFGGVEVKCGKTRVLFSIVHLCNFRPHNHQVLENQTKIILTFFIWSIEMMKLLKRACKSLHIASSVFSCMDSIIITTAWKKGNQNLNIYAVFMFQNSFCIRHSDLVKSKKRLTKYLRNGLTKCIENWQKSNSV